MPQSYLVYVTITSSNFISSHIYKYSTLTQAQMPYKLTYFNERGRAEPIRLILQWAGQSFKDVRLNDQEFVRSRKGKSFREFIYTNI
jgi:hypothetical protein